MYSEDLERENFEREIKKLKYEKWVAENQHASDRQKKRLNGNILIVTLFQDVM